MTEQEKIWAAAVIDASSYFYFRRGKTSNYPSFRMRRDRPEILTALASLFGGKVQYQDKSRIFYWNLGGAKMTPMIIAILPYLKEKQQQARIMLEHIFLQQTKAEAGRKFHVCTKEEKAEMARVLKALDDLGKDNDEDDAIDLPL